MLFDRNSCSRREKGYRSKRLLGQGEKALGGVSRVSVNLSPRWTNDTDNIHVVKIDNYVFEEEPPTCPNFPVVAPPTPHPRIRKVSPDIHISPVGCPDYLLSPLPPQEDAFLIVHVRSLRVGRPQRQERLRFTL